MEPVDSLGDAIPSPVPPQNPQDPQNIPQKPPSRVRKRAKKACLSCRSRKVRCDVSLRGPPCANCYLDNEQCVVTGRASKYRRPQKIDVQHSVQMSLPPCELQKQPASNLMNAETLEPAISCSPLDERSCAVPDGLGADISTDFPIYVSDNNSNLGTEQAKYSKAQENLGSSTKPDHTFVSCGLPEFFLGSNETSNDVLNQCLATSSITMSSEISFYLYPFLTVTNLHQLPQQDAAFLESQGCFRVPMRPFLDELVQQYFLHIHPFLPLINEGDFWESYCHDTRYPPKHPIPVLLLQSMLFAACTFTSEPTIRALGYCNTRSMRTTFMRRAKLLYNLECESSHTVIAQACVLLSFSSLSSSRKPNTLWLNHAIHHARLAEADAYATMGSLPTRKQNILKRLWWCCIIRDRSISLLMRLPICITKDQFDFNDPLTGEDLRDEFERSRVYTTTTKQKLAEIIAYSVKLCITLTEILTLIHPPKGMKSFVQQQQDNKQTKLQQCKASLKRWYTSAASNIPPCPSIPTSSNTPRKPSHEPVILYTNFMYMYYHTARTVLCHYEVLQLDLEREGADSLHQNLSKIFEARSELQDATSDIADCHMELLRLGLIQWLPGLAVGFILLPLILNILDVKLSSSSSKTDSERAQASGTTSPQQLKMLIQFMKAYWFRYDGVEWVGDIIRHVISLTQLDETQIRRKSSNVINWKHVFAFQPRSYLRLVYTLDVGLSKGRLPQDGDFPIKLRGLFGFNSNPLKEFVEGTRNYSDLESLAISVLPPEPQFVATQENMGVDQEQQQSPIFEDWLVTSSENLFAFGEWMRLPEATGAESQEESWASPSEHLEALGGIQSPTI